MSGKKFITDVDVIVELKKQCLQEMLRLGNQKAVDALQEKKVKIMPRMVYQKHQFIKPGHACVRDVTTLMSIDIKTMGVGG